MAMSVIRCPFCDRRYNVTGIPSGTKVLCTSCQATLTVPASNRRRPSVWRRLIPESSSAQVALGLVSGLVLATSMYLALRPRPTLPAVAESPVPPPPAVERETPSRDATAGMLPPSTREDQIQRFMGRIYDEFGHNAFSFDQRSSSPFCLAGEHRGMPPYLMFNEYQDAIENLVLYFRNEFREPLSLGEIDEVLPVVIFTSRDSYGDYMRKGNNPAEVAGLYEESKLRSVFFHDGAARGYRIDVALHEATHQIIHYYFRREADQELRQSWWFREGMGAYFEQFTRSNTGRVVVDPSRTSARLPALKDAVRRTELFPLYKLMELDDDEIGRFHKVGVSREEHERNQRFAQLCYGEAWALVHYLRHGAGGKYRGLFNEYFLKELRGKGGRYQFERLLLDRFGMEIQQLEPEVEEYIRSLPLP